LAVGDEGDSGAGDVLGVQDFSCGGLKFFKRFGMREFVFLRGRLLGKKQGRSGETDQECGDSACAHFASK